jgi:BirA family biotin operon repressor/biotin-[acetyl-CoA-carboxylase] ligase
LFFGCCLIATGSDPRLPILPLKRFLQLSIFVLLKNSDLLPHTPVFPPIGQPFIVLPSVDSTNNYAMAQARAGLAIHGTVYLAMEQTNGKGQRGKSWSSKPGDNIMLSVVLEPKALTIGNHFILSASVALACYDFLKKYTDPEMTRIKLPNDLYWQDRKAGGVLIESGVGSRESGVAAMQRVIVGIGININQTAFDEHLRNPVSVKQITGKDWDIIELAKELCACLEQRYLILTTKNNTNKILEEYSTVLYKLNEKVRLKKDNAVFETVIKGVTPEGRLLTKDTMERTFDFGEIEWVL